MNTHNICICKENQKKNVVYALSSTPLVKSFADLILKADIDHEFRIWLFNLSEIIIIGPKWLIISSTPQH